MEAIDRDDEATEILPVTDKAQYRNIWVYMELVDGKFRNVGLELLGQGRILADTTGEKLAAVVIGDQVEEAAASLFAYGADQVYLSEAPELADYSTDGHTKVLTELIQKYKPSVILLGATHNGRDIGPRVACRVRTGLTADCTGLDIDRESGLVAWTRPAFGGNIMAVIHCPDHRPQMGTVRPAVFKKPVPDSSRTGEIIRYTGSIKPADIRTKILETVKETGSGVKLEEAEIIVSGGRGLGKKENFALVKELAEVLGASVGASRAAVDAGWIPQIHQVGQTGTTVAPKIYIACGISGAVQHLVGMSSADIIIAINRDPDAPIFRAANYCLVGDVLEILPLMTAEFKRVKNA